MNKQQRMFEELRKNPKNVRFERLCAIAEAFGFRMRGGQGSHRIYVRDGVKELLNFQNVGGKAKPYQVKQFIKLIEKYGLLEEERDA
jgi:predicted RNA binding protein YcfA (HicA-like mRNA interferase family)